MIKVYWTRSYIGHDKIPQMGPILTMLSALRIEEPILNETHGLT